MEFKRLLQLSPSDLDRLLSRIPFYRELRAHDAQQLSVVLRHSELVEPNPGEVVVRRGEAANWLYFLCRGQLAVYPGDQVLGEPVGQITPGELFGDLAFVLGQERRATVAVDPDSRRAAQLFGTDFSCFGELEQFHVVSVQTKLLFYRTLVHSIRWRLELKRMQQPDHPLVAKMLKIPLFYGVKGGIEELRALDLQARAMAQLLDQWNNEQGILETAVGMP